MDFKELFDSIHKQCFENYIIANKKDSNKWSLPVGARGFEPPTSCTPCKRASRTAPRPKIPSYQLGF